MHRRLVDRQKSGWKLNVVSNDMTGAEKLIPNFCEIYSQIKNDSEDAIQNLQSTYRFMANPPGRGTCMPFVSSPLYESLTEHKINCHRTFRTNQKKMPGKFSPSTQKLKWDEGTVTVQRTNTVNIYTSNTVAFQSNTTSLTKHFLLQAHILACHIPET